MDQNHHFLITKKAQSVYVNLNFIKRFREIRIESMVLCFNVNRLLMPRVPISASLRATKQTVFCGLLEVLHLSCISFRRKKRKNKIRRKWFNGYFTDLKGYVLLYFASNSWFYEYFPVVININDSYDTHTYARARTHTHTHTHTHTYTHTHTHTHTRHTHTTHTHTQHTHTHIVVVCSCGGPIYFVPPKWGRVCRMVYERKVDSNLLTPWPDCAQHIHKRNFNPTITGADSYTPIHTIYL